VTALPNRHYSGHCKATEIEGNHRTPEEFSRKKFAQQISGTTVERWRQYMSILDTNTALESVTYKIVQGH